MSVVGKENVASHVFNIAIPSRGESLKNPDPSKGHDHDIMQNSCGASHDNAWFIGDND